MHKTLFVPMSSSIKEAPKGPWRLLFRISRPPPGHYWRLWYLLRALLVPMIQYIEGAAGAYGSIYTCSKIADKQKYSISIFGLFKLMLTKKRYIYPVNYNTKIHCADCHRCRNIKPELSPIINVFWFNNPVKDTKTDWLKSKPWTCHAECFVLTTGGCIV